MSDTIFPFLQTVKHSELSKTDLPLYRDVLWRMTDNRAEMRPDGEPIFCTGNQAIAGWIVRALRTRRYADGCHTFNYGSELHRLIGKQWQPATRTAEAKRYISDCLMSNPYITDVTIDSVEIQENGTLVLNCNIKTVYGDLRLEDISV